MPLASRMNLFCAALCAVSLTLAPTAAQAQQCVDMNSTEGVALEAFLVAFDATEKAVTTSMKAFETLNLFTMLTAITQVAQAQSAVLAAMDRAAVMAPSALRDDLLESGVVLSGIADTLGRTVGGVTSTVGDIMNGRGALARLNEEVARLAVEVQSLPPLCRF